MKVLRDGDLPMFKEDFHFLTKLDEIFCGVKVDAYTAGNNFTRSLDTLEILKNG